MSGALATQGMWWAVVGERASLDPGHSVLAREPLSLSECADLRRADNARREREIEACWLHLMDLERAYRVRRISPLGKF